MTTGYASGVFDMFHVGHLNLLRRARARCERLVVGVITDEATLELKGYRPVVPLDERMAIVSELRCVDEVVVDTSLDKTLIWAEHRFDVFYKGDDWNGSERGKEIEALLATVGARVEYLHYTPHTSSTHLREALNRLMRPL